MSKIESNLLIHEKSPYLLQHARNPVHWHAWNEDAFERAAREDKPVFLSIGYSTCHWCHVMEHESFEDDEVAELLNDRFVSIKVDREERPDIDNIYMTVCQLTTGSGGWPLTIFMTPDKTPFFAATYIPKQARFNRTGMTTLLPQISNLWTSDRSRILQSAENILAGLQSSALESGGDDLGADVMQSASNIFRQNFDEINGGIGHEPKFPVPHNLLFLLRQWKRHGDDNALLMTEKTLHFMRHGGIHDHIGFGFHRYSTDRVWLVPHFEKMLYDQALLCLAYTECHIATRKPCYRETARTILTYVLRDMTDPSGGFYSAEDADSEGVEGKFYVWTQAEVRAIFPAAEAEAFIETFSLTTDGNFAEEATGQKTGDNIPHLRVAFDPAQAESEFDAPNGQWAGIRETLYTHREQRIHPYKDDKILVDWNGLMIAAFCRASRAFKVEEYTKAAARAADFILTRLRAPDGGLLHRFRDGDAAIAGHLDDYAFLTWGLIDLFQASFRVDFLQAALDLQAYVDQHFRDQQGGYFFSADNAEALILRKKEYYDGAIPSGNAVAWYNLVRFAAITGNTAFEERAAELGRANAQAIRQLPVSHSAALIALDASLGPSIEVVLVAEQHDPVLQTFIDGTESLYLPNMVRIVKTAENAAELAELAPYTESQQAIEGKPTAYVCSGNACNEPTTDLNRMLEQIQSVSAI
jgi:uncharacterized protein YyaL (SSP411 family)